MTPFGVQLRYLRKDRRVSQKDLAAAVGVGSKTITAIEAGRRGPLADAQIHRISELLALDPHEDRTLREAARVSSYTARIPKVASPQAMRAAHTMVGIVSELQPTQIAALERAAKQIRSGANYSGESQAEGTAMNA